MYRGLLDEDQRQQAMGMGLLSAGLGTLAAPPTWAGPMSQIGQGGLQGLQTYATTTNQMGRMNLLQDRMGAEEQERERAERHRQWQRGHTETAHQDLMGHRQDALTQRGETASRRLDLTEEQLEERRRQFEEQQRRFNEQQRRLDEEQARARRRQEALMRMAFGSDAEQPAPAGSPPGLLSPDAPDAGGPAPGGDRGGLLGPYLDHPDQDVQKQAIAETFKLLDEDASFSDLGKSLENIYKAGGMDASTYKNIQGKIKALEESGAPRYIAEGLATDTIQWRSDPILGGATVLVDTRTWPFRTVGRITASGQWESDPNYRPELPGGAQTQPHEGQDAGVAGRYNPDTGKIERPTAQQPSGLLSPQERKRQDEALRGLPSSPGYGPGLP